MEEKPSDWSLASLLRPFSHLIHSAHAFIFPKAKSYPVISMSFQTVLLIKSKGPCYSGPQAPGHPPLTPQLPLKFSITHAAFQLTQHTLASGLSSMLLPCPELSSLYLCLVHLCSPFLRTSPRLMGAPFLKLMALPHHSMARMYLAGYFSDPASDCKLCVHFDHQFIPRPITEPGTHDPQ